MRRAEVTSQNIANIATPGYKRRISFDQYTNGAAPPQLQTTTMATAIDLSAGKQIDTGNPLDLAISGSGYFVLNTPDGPLYTRQGQFKRDAADRLVTPEGYALQIDGGPDLVLKDGPFEVAPGGVVIQDGTPVAKLALADLTDATAVTYGPAGTLRIPDEAIGKAAGAVVRQGALESSNVSTADEMVALMAATRRAETAQRIIGVYDDLMGRALTAFGQS